MFGKLIARLVGKKVAPLERPRRVPWLRVERLEAREVPALVLWTGAFGTDFDDPDNWLGGVPQAGDDVYFVPRLGHVVSGDGEGDPFGEGDPISVPPVSIDCTGMHAPAGGGDYASVTLTAAYDGTVTLSSGFTAGGLALGGGTLDQPAVSVPYAPADITVTSHFEWTGGTLNSTSNPATLTVTGTTATALFEPTDGGTVELGSNITLDGGAVATMKEGTITVTNNDLEFNVHANCGLLVDPGQGKQLKIDAGGQITTGEWLLIWNDGYYRILSGKWEHVGRVSVVGGEFTLMGGTTAVLLPVPLVPGGLVPIAFSQTDGGTYLSSGSTLDLTGNRMFMSSGTLVTESGLTPATILGNVTISGGDVMVDSTIGGDNHQFGTLAVNGNMTWNGGTWWPWMDAGGSESDTWDITGSLAVGGTATLRPRGVDGENNPVVPDPNRTWVLFKTATGITNANGTPSIPGDCPGSWAIDPVPNNPVKQWNLKST